MSDEKPTILGMIPHLRERGAGGDLPIRVIIADYPNEPGSVVVGVEMADRHIVFGCHTTDYRAALRCAVQRGRSLGIPVIDCSFEVISKDMPSSSAPAEGPGGDAA